MAEDTSRKRKVRGRKIRGDREAKKRLKARKKLARSASQTKTKSETASKSRGSHIATESGDDHLIDPADAAPDPFVETDAVAAVRDRITGWLAADQPVHLIGPTGAGKTALALAAAATRGRPVVLCNGDEAVDTSALVGGYSGGERYEERDEYVSGVSKKTQIVRDRWVDNPLSVAVREGATLVYNEFSRSDPAAHNVLLSVLEEGVLERPGKHGANRSIDVHPEFRVIFTSNDVEYAGVHQQQDALLDRMVGVHVDYYDAETEREIVRSHVAVSDEAIETVVDATRTLREELPVVVGTRTAITAAKGISVFDDWNGDEAAPERADGGRVQVDGDDDLLADVLTDVLGPKVAGAETEIDGMAALHSQISEVLRD
ncbi:gas-vesicle operon protein GvpN [Natrialba magadii ATCC 43099]|uniref:Gas vesicle protein GvpN n=1 Tax=Natrialba magadii (strain ATCC 43099 / DSM 3394 / CCM 3739 / CIP 104546 / IAM 13178 / JCM 8861 / NBRC 102185 / NCIMB 2190 / MS3) TaxID=547559 RepID=D3SXA3_NATMM|nr:gas vesicle protein GvpN [Natrialba magadii]ADD03923.1 gas-vesicle operon protein GvpN [Natrialba magadii ATCC 43099]ELY33585.1 gas vesicle protein GvpN [Natrialba magadii ATCC 43099]